MYKFNKITQIIATSFLFVTSLTYADSFEVSITNTTAGQVITPPFMITHNDNITLFKVGHPAADFLIPFVEDGDTSSYAGAEKHKDISAIMLSQEPILPGHSLTLSIETTEEFPLITLAGMFATSNDAFVALHDQVLKFDDSRHIYSANVYDAGTEYNSEECTYIPGPPCGNGGVRDTENAEGFVTIHSGIHGIADLKPESVGWANPGAIISIRRTK